ncbi:MAG: phage tail sheath family protein [Chitinophagaceae bacterium]|nr:phage tail sheath family protein [Chitinophagaceae bacterium]
MANDFKTPGVYIVEIPKLPPSIASVETAIPAFIGYTEKAFRREANDLRDVPWRIESLLEYEQYFGSASPEAGSLQVVFDNSSGRLQVQAKADEVTRSKFLMYYALQMFFANGGGPCWIVSVGNYVDGGGLINDADLSRGLAEVEKINEVTLLNFPDAINLTDATVYYNLYKQAMDQCTNLQDRFTVFDLFHDVANGTTWRLDVDFMRTTVTNDINALKYAGIYFPKVYTTVNFNYAEDTVAIVTTGGAPALPATLAELKNANNAAYFQAKNALNNIENLLPVSSGILGIYAQVDNSRGVWKAPANINIDNVIRPEIIVSKEQQGGLNVDDTAGKSINVIRKFEGRGPAIVWGARTLAGNDNEWRYVSVRRFFNMVEESTKNATEQFVFEPNDRNTWVRVKSMIENYLTTLWKAGALFGTSTREAFYVKVGLGETMTELDLWEGRMYVEIGLAVVRPAEFIILKFMHKMLQEA